MASFISRQIGRFKVSRSFSRPCKWIFVRPFCQKPIDPYYPACLETIGKCPILIERIAIFIHMVLGAFFEPNDFLGFFQWIKWSKNKNIAQYVEGYSTPHFSLIFTTFVVKNSDLVTFVIFFGSDINFPFLHHSMPPLLHVRTIFEKKKSSEHDLFISYLMTTSFNKDCHQWN